MDLRPLVIATASYEVMAGAIARAAGFEPGAVGRRGFPDGERYLRLPGCLGRDVVVVGGTVSDRDTLELYDLACGAVGWGASRLTLVLPYFGYSTMERAGTDGEVVTAKNRARLLSSVPTAPLGNRVYLFDLHAEGVAHYFEGGLHPFHVWGRRFSEAACRRLGGDDFVLACTDAGRAKWVESLASDLGVDAAFIYKRRIDGERTEVIDVSAHVRGRVVVIYDDMIRTGSSILGAARAYREAGATRVAAVCTHGVFPGDALDQLRGSGLISEIVASDSHPRAVELAGDFLAVESVADLLAARLREGM